MSSDWALRVNTLVGAVIGCVNFNAEKNTAELQRPDILQNAFLKAIDGEGEEIAQYILNEVTGILVMTGFKDVAQEVVDVIIKAYEKRDIAKSEAGASSAKAFDKMQGRGGLKAPTLDEKKKSETTFIPPIRRV